MSQLLPKEGSLESYLNKPIECRRLKRLRQDINREAIRRFVRLKTAKWCRLQDMRGYGKKGDLLDYSINKTLVALQQEILEKEGWPSAELRQEALDAQTASQPKDSPEIRAYFEQLWGPLKYPEIHSTDL